MYVLYLDDSGSVSDPNQENFVLGGICVPERSIYHIMEDTEECVNDFDYGDINVKDVGAIELHASEIFNGRRFPWKTISKEKRNNNILTILEKVIKQNHSINLFAVVIHKQSASPNDPVEIAFEELCNRFNLFLTRRYNRTGEQNRGLIIMDKSKHETPLQKLATNYRTNGSRWGKFRNLAEVPLFVDSKATRLMQLADFVAWSTFRNYEKNDKRFFDRFVSKFDADGGVIHGLYHHNTKHMKCECPACKTRYNAKNNSWFEESEENS